MPQLSRLSGALILMVWVGLCRPFTLNRTYFSLCSAVAIAVSFFLLLQEATWLPGILLCVLALSMLLKKKSPSAAGELHVYLLTVLFYTAFFIFYKYSPHAWFILQKVSLSYSAAVSAVVGNRMTLGATAAAVPVTVSVLCYCAGLCCFNRKVSFIIPSIIICVLTNAAYLWLQGPLSYLVRLIDSTVKPTPFDFQAFLPLLSAAGLYPLIRKIRFSEIPSGFSSVRRKHAITALVLVCACVASLVLYAGGNWQKGRIVFYDLGANWSVPFYGKSYGQKSAGMFGILPYYLKMRGYDTGILKKKLTRDVLQDASVLVVFNPVKYLSSDEKQLIYGFIENGGALLVAGDHTDVSGIMGPINDILKPFNIRLNFDTALPINSGWIYCLEKRPHPITTGIENDYETGIWVGASLDIAPPARPVIIGRSGWADRGDYSNRKRAFLGDYKRDSQEQLGDVVLVAESAYGKGRVLVFGDTSSFQNGVIANTHFFLDRVFSWLSSVGTKYYPAQQGLAALVLLMLAGYMLARRPNVLLYFACGLAANAVLWLGPCSRSEMKGPAPSASGFAKPSFYKPAFIDISHMERFAPFASSDKSLWGLSINLMRNRYMPFFMKEISGTGLAEANLLIVNSPAIPFTRNETGLLKDYLQKGGSIIWAVGWEEFEASKSFLSEFGLSVDSVPLGSAEIKLKKATVKFVEAWPVTGGSDLKQIIIEKWGHAIIVYQPVGRGGILLIGDSEFLHSRNIESYKTYNPGNIRFVRYLLNKLEKLKSN